MVLLPWVIIRDAGAAETEKSPTDCEFTVSVTVVVCEVPPLVPVIVSV